MQTRNDIIEECALHLDARAGVFKQLMVRAIESEDTNKTHQFRREMNITEDCARALRALKD